MATPKKKDMWPSGTKANSIISIPGGFDFGASESSKKRFKIERQSFLSQHIFQRMVESVGAFIRIRAETGSCSPVTEEREGTFLSPTGATCLAMRCPNPSIKPFGLLVARIQEPSTMRSIDVDSRINLVIGGQCGNPLRSPTTETYPQPPLKQNAQRWYVQQKNGPGGVAGVVDQVPQK
jgi:hypothetical protein